MGKKQTRRSISVKGTTYHRLRRFCDLNGVSVSGYIETLIDRDMVVKNQPEVSRAEADRLEEQSRRRRSTDLPASDPTGSQHFTF